MTEDTNPLFYNGETYRLNDSIGYLMGQIVSKSSAVVDERMVEFGLTNAQWKPLLLIQKGHCRTAVELARLSSCDSGAMTRLLDRLEAKGLVRRVRSQEDRRVVNLELTEEGERAAMVVPYVLADVLNAMLLSFSEAEAQQLKNLLQRLLGNTCQLAERGAD